MTTPDSNPPAPAAPAGPARPAEGEVRPAGRPASGPGGRPAFVPRAPGSRPPSGRPGDGRDFRGGRRGPPRRKVCRFCADKLFEVDYKAIHILRGFITGRGKLLSGRTTGNCARHQRQLTAAIKRAQNIALLPFTGE